jgi:hypothetical protein
MFILFVTDKVTEYLSKLSNIFQSCCSWKHFNIKNVSLKGVHILLVVWLFRYSFTLTETPNKILCFQGCAFFDVWLVKQIALATTNLFQEKTEFRQTK